MEECPLPCLITGDRRAPQFLETPKVSRGIQQIDYGSYSFTPPAVVRVSAPPVPLPLLGARNFNPKMRDIPTPNQTLQKRVFFWFVKWIHCCSIPETNGFYQGLHAPRLERCLETRWHRREGARGVMKNVCVSRNPKNNRGNKMV